MSIEVLTAEVAGLKQEVKALERTVQQLQNNDAANAVRFSQIKDDIGAMKRMVNWAVTLILGTILVAALQFMIKGGISG